jgi:HAD superfamily hydrolase (TIGR01509 family)
VPSALLLDVGHVVISPSARAVRAYEAATGTEVPEWDDLVARDDPEAVNRDADRAGLLEMFRALAAAVPDSLFDPDAVDLMSAAGDAGVPVGVLSNHAHAILGRDWFAGRPEFAGLRTFVDAAEEGFPKPAPQGYLLAAEQLGVPASEVVFLDDTPECIDGATAIGMTGVLVDPADRRPAFDEARRLLGIA